MGQQHKSWRRGGGGKSLVSRKQQLTVKSLGTRGVWGSATNHGGGEVLRSTSPPRIGYVWKGSGLARNPSTSYDSEEDLQRETKERAGG